MPLSLSPGSQETGLSSQEVWSAWSRGRTIGPSHLPYMYKQGHPVLCEKYVLYRTQSAGFNAVMVPLSVISSQSFLQFKQVIKFNERLYPFSHEGQYSVLPKTNNAIMNANT